MDNKPMKILFFEPSSGFGGSGNALFNLLSRIDKNRFKPIVVTLEDGPQFEKIKDLGIKVIKLNTGFEIASPCFAGFAMTRLIKKYKVDLVHINTNIISGIPAISAAKICSIPCICHIRQTRPLIKRERFFIKFIDKIIVLNQEVNMMLSKFVPSERISLIYDGIDLKNDEINEVRVNVKDEFNLNGHSLIGMISRLVEGKGCGDFIKAASIVAKTKKEVKFLVVGNAADNDKKMEDRLKILGHNFGLDGNLIFTGWRNDVKSVISSLDISVQPYTSPEGLPNVVIEAMALGKPVVTTNIAGPSDVVIDNETGFLVPPSDVDTLAGKIVYLLENPDAAKNMGREGRKRVEEFFDIKNTVTRIENIYSEMLNSN